MSRKLKLLLALMCAVIFAGALCTGAFAAGDDEESSVTVISYSEVPLYADNVYIGSGILIDSTTYVPLLSFTEAMLGEYCHAVWDQETESTTLISGGLVITLSLDDQYMTANGRHLYLAGGAYNFNGTLIVPVRELAKVFSLEVDWEEDSWSVHIDTSEMEILQSAEEFYDPNDLYWLSHVIYAESGNQPLEGMIGVGNVVLNRLNDSSGCFADSIKDVIFQPGQFAVAETGAIYMEPNALSVVAAKLCLEGYNTVDDCKWFVNPKMSSTRWFDTYTTLLHVIEDHNFYA